MSTEIKIPDIGTTAEVDVIEVFVKPGDVIKKDDPLLTLEGEKASMELPSPMEGTVKEVKVKVGDKVVQDQVIVLLETADKKDKPSEVEKSEIPLETKPEKKITETKEVKKAAETEPVVIQSVTDIHASPAVRRLARELGVDLNTIAGTGEKNRITLEDVHLYVKTALKRGTAGGISVAEAPTIDFSKFGPTETTPLSKIKRLTGKNVHRAWVTVPHVTQFDEADITDLEAFRQAQKAMAEKEGIKLTPLVFLMKVVVTCLKRFPTFNASLDNSGENLILKKFFNIGVAVDTPNGLVVPVIRDVDKKGILELAKELAEISQKAREKGLSLNDMQGGCFTISSLGGIGGTAFTPIVNAPEVAILGVSRSQLKPVYINNQFVPRLMLPLSLSYDHRVIDGAEAARFITFLSELLKDISKLLLY